ncbi:MAG: multiheme c-type cytochrome [Polyangiaceae bacterium]
MTPGVGAQSVRPGAIGDGVLQCAPMRAPPPVLLVLCALTACSDREAPVGGASPLRLDAAATVPALVEAGAEPPMPAPYRARGDAAVATNAGCVGCHADQAAEWRGSLHARAASDGAYRRALAKEPSPFCRGCHAPEADPEDASLTPAALAGVACVTCHVTEEGSVLAAPPLAGAGPAPHPLRRSAAFAGAGACQGCHEFAFPGAGGDGDAQLMQTTVREHARSEGGGQACADCHMPRREGRRSHSFAEVRDAGWLRARLRARPEVVPGALRVTLEQPEPGHAFPTGDLFRRLEVRAELRDRSGRVLDGETRWLGRQLLLVPGHAARQLVGDDRVFDEPRTVDLPLQGATAGATVAFAVTYQRVATTGTGHDPSAAEIESQVLLHDGVLPWPSMPGAAPRQAP